MNLHLINYDMNVPPSVMKMKNNGHTAVIQLRDSMTPNAWTPKMSGSVVGNDEFQLTQLHFHWDRTDARIGSEHALHGTRRAFEMHLVHFNTKYGGPAEASLHPDGFSVIGTIFDNTDDDENNNLELDKIVMQLREISGFNTSVNLKRPLNLRNLLPRDIDTFYSYEGSLTTPPCSEVITWVIFPQVQKIGPNQLFMFERSLDTDGSNIMGTTCRDLQPLYERTVVASSDAFCSGGVAKPSTALITDEGVHRPSSPSSPSSSPTTRRPKRPRKVIITTDGSTTHARPGLVPGLLQGLLGK